MRILNQIIIIFITEWNKIMDEDNDDQKSLDNSPKYFAAIQITRPRSATRDGKKLLTKI